MRFDMGSHRLRIPPAATAMIPWWLPHASGCKRWRWQCWLEPVGALGPWGRRWEIWGRSLFLGTGDWRHVRLSLWKTRGIFLGKFGVRINFHVLQIGVHGSSDDQKVEWTAWALASDCRSLFHLGLMVYQAQQDGTPVTLCLQFLLQVLAFTPVLWPKIHHSFLGTLLLLKSAAWLDHLGNSSVHLSFLSLDFHVDGNPSLSCFQNPWSPRFSLQGTYFVYMLSTTVVPLLRVLCSDATERRASLQDGAFRWFLCGTVVCGIVSGCGGMLSTFAFAQENKGYSGALKLGEVGLYFVGGETKTKIWQGKWHLKLLNRWGKQKAGSICWETKAEDFHRGERYLHGLRRRVDHGAVQGWHLTLLKKTEKSLWQLLSLAGPWQNSQGFHDFQIFSILFQAILKIAGNSEQAADDQCCLRDAGHCDMVDLGAWRSTSPKIDGIQMYPMLWWWKDVCFFLVRLFSTA